MVLIKGYKRAYISSYCNYYYVEILHSLEVIINSKVDFIAKENTTRTHVI
jgi:hypothetical protein